MPELISLGIFVVLVALVAVAGVGLGMLLAPRIGRLAERNEEEQGADDD